MNTAKQEKILDYIDSYYNSCGETPTVRDISRGTGIPVATAHRCLLALSERGELAYDGRKSVSTKRMRMECSHTAMPVLGYVACGEGQEEEEQIIEYIRMPESIVGNGNFFALIAKGESMIDAGVHPGDYVVVNKDKQPKIGDIVVALLDGRSNLKVLGYDETKNSTSCNPAIPIRRNTQTFPWTVNSPCRALPSASPISSHECKTQELLSRR